MVIVDHTQAPSLRMPDLEIAFEEANRPHAIAKMVIAELKSAEAIDDNTIPGGHMKSDPAEEIRTYLAA